VDIPGATSKDYTISNAGMKDVGQYWVKVSNPAATVTSGQGTPNPTVVLVKATGVFAIEAEDFDYDSGQTKAEASVMPYLGGAYAGLSAVLGVDYQNDDDPGNNLIDGHPLYRWGGPLGSNADDPNTNATIGNETPGGLFASTRMGEWTMTANYKIGWVGAGNWGNYTRTFPEPAKEYYVFAAGSYDGVAASQLDGSLGVVTAGIGTATQTVQTLGTFNAPGTGDWSRNSLVALADSSGAMKTVQVGGKATIRWTYNSGDAEYLAFVPVTQGGAQPKITSIVKNANGSITITWEGGGTLQAAESVLGPWQDVTSSSPYTVTPTQNILFGRIKK